MTNKQHAMTGYESPVIEIFRIAAEKGFAESDWSNGFLPDSNDNSYDMSGF